MSPGEFQKKWPTMPEWTAEQRQRHADIYERGQTVEYADVEIVQSSCECGMFLVGERIFHCSLCEIDFCSDMCLQDHNAGCHL